MFITRERKSMCCNGNTGRPGIWRASYRKSIVDAIVSCSEESANGFAAQLQEWCPNAGQMKRELDRITAEISSRIRGADTPDNRLRLAILERVARKALGIEIVP